MIAISTNPPNNALMNLGPPFSKAPRRIQLFETEQTRVNFVELRVRDELDGGRSSTGLAGAVEAEDGTEEILSTREGERVLSVGEEGDEDFGVAFDVGECL